MCKTLFGFLLGLIGTSFGVLLAYFLGECRRRKDAAEELYINLTKERGCISAGNGISKTEFDRFRFRLFWWETKTFDKYVDTYYQAKIENHRLENSGVFHKGAASIQSAIDNLIKFIKKI